MNARERFNATLNFDMNIDRGAVMETFYPWDLTLERWKNEGLSRNLIDYMWCPKGKVPGSEEVYLNSRMAEGVYNFESYFGFDGVKRVTFNLPFFNFEEKIIKDTDEYCIKQCNDGWQRKFYKERDLVEETKPVVESIDDWNRLKERAKIEIEKNYTDENIIKIYSPFIEGHKRGDYSIRLNVPGFFWTPRTLLGIEEHMYALYDYPEMINDMNEFILQVYIDKLSRVLDILPADLVYIMEDLSGTNGPMLSPAHFDEFIGAYYKKLIPLLKEHGVKNVFVDTDGDFKSLIPNFIEAGVDGFLPMDVNAGMDIVAVREKFPKVKFIGAFNKLCIAEGKEAIDKEFERLMPVIKQGGYIPGADHQVAPSTSLEDYKYYIKRLKEVMKEAFI
jgi:hypothetical protein